MGLMSVWGDYDNGKFTFNPLCKDNMTIPIKIVLTDNNISPKSNTYWFNVHTVYIEFSNAGIDQCQISKQLSAKLKYVD